MKFILFGAFILCSINISAQVFIDSNEAMVVIQDIKDATSLELVNISDADLYLQKKNDLKAYQIFESHITDLDVEESLKLAVLEVMHVNVTEADYNNNILDPELLRIKTNLVSILSQ